MANKIQLRRDTAGNWTNTIVLSQGEIGVEWDTGKFKLGDGTSNWGQLDYFEPGTGGGTALPAQTGQAGKYLTTNGTVLSWATVTGGTGGGLSVTDFGRGFTDTLDAGKITTSKLYNRPANLALNNHFVLEVTDGGVIVLPDQSTINGATLKSVAGNYAGITAGPVGKDEDSWMWVDGDGAWIGTKYNTDQKLWHFNNDGALTFPQGTTIATADGTDAFIIDGAVDKDIQIYTYSGPTPTAHGWTFGADGTLTLPDSATVAVGDIGVLQGLELAYDNSREQLNAAFAADSYEGDGWPAGPNSYNALLLSTDPAIRPEWIPLAQSVRTAWLALGSALEPIYLDIQVAGYTWNFSNAGDFSVPGNKAIKGFDNLQLNVDGGGGKTAVVEIDGYNSKVLIKTTTPGAGIPDDAWTFGDAGELTLPVGGVIQTLTTPQVGTRLTDIPGWIRADINAKTAGFWMDTTPQSLKDAMDATGLVDWQFNPDGTTDYYTVLAAEYVEGNTILELTFDANLPLESAPYSVTSPNYSTRTSSNISILANENEWTFNTDGNLTLPAGGDIVDSTGTTVLGGTADTGSWTFDTVTATTDGNIIVKAGSGEASWASLLSNNGANSFWVDDVGAHVASNFVEGETTENYWTFGTDGSLTLPEGSYINETTPIQGFVRTKYAGSSNGDVNYFTTATLIETSIITTFIESYDDSLVGGADYSFQYVGYFKAPVTGLYTFTLYGDDYAKCWIGDNAIAGYTSGNSSIYTGYNSNNFNTIELTANNFYPIRIQCWNSSGPGYFSFSWAGPDGGPDNNFTGVIYTAIGQTEITAISRPIVLNTNNIDTDYQWTFGTDGSLQLPAGGTIAEGGGISGAIRITPAGGANVYQALLIYPTAEGEGDHIHLTAGGGTTDLYLGNDDQFVKIDHGGNVVVATTNANHWTFDTTGDLTLPTVITGTGSTVKSQSAIRVQAGQYYLSGIYSSSSGWGSGSGNYAAFPTDNSPDMGALVIPGDIAHSGSIHATVASVISSLDNGGQWVIEIGSPSDSAYSGGTGSWSFSKTGDAGGMWKFDTNGSLTFPDATTSTGRSVTVPVNQAFDFNLSTSIPSVDTSKISINYGGISTDQTSLYLTTSGSKIWIFNSAQKRIEFNDSSAYIKFGTETKDGTGASNDIELFSYGADNGAGAVYISAGSSPTNNRWKFGSDGSLTLPGTVVNSTVAKDGPTLPTTTGVLSSLNHNFTFSGLTDGTYGPFTLGVVTFRILVSGGTISSFVNVSATGNVTVNDVLGTIGSGDLGGAPGLHTITITVQDVVQAAAVAIDLTKTINKLADGFYSLADGVEGQIMYLVRQTGNDGDTTIVEVANARANGLTFTNLGHRPFRLGVITVDIDMLIFTDGAWQATPGDWGP